MKKIVIFSLVMTALFLVACVPAFADTIATIVKPTIHLDSTGVVSGAKFLQALISANTWSTIAVWGGVLFLISEGLSCIPAIKANGIFQFIFNLLKWVFSGGASKI